MNIIEHIKYRLWLKKHSRYCEFMRKREDKKKVEFLVNLLVKTSVCEKHNIHFNAYDHIIKIIDDFCPECYKKKIVEEAEALNAKK